MTEILPAPLLQYPSIPSERDKAKLLHTLHRIGLIAALCLTVFSFAVPAECFANWWIESGDLSPVNTALVLAAVVLPRQTMVHSYTHVCSFGC